MTTDTHKGFLVKRFEDRPDWCFFFIIFCVSFIFRAYAAMTSIAPLYPDEIFQTVEMAHKVAFGKGFVFWEFSVGARSWFLPGILAGVYKTLDLIGVSDPYCLNMFLKLFLVFFHALAVSVLYLLFRKWFENRFTAFIFTLPIAFSYQLSYISAHTLSESTALPFMVFTLYQASKYIENSKSRHLVFTIVFAGIAYMLRFQTAAFSFGLAIAFSIISEKRIRTSLIFGFGYIGMILLHGVFDKLTWGKFMHSFITYYDYNILRGVANKHGVSPWNFYLNEIAASFNPLIYISAFLFSIYIVVLFRKKKSEFIFLFPNLFFLVIHSAISHKEPRFVFPFYFVILAFSSAFFAFLYEKFFKDRFLIAVFFVTMTLTAYTFSFISFQENWNTSIAWYEYWGNDKGFNKRIDGNLEISMHMGRIETLKSAAIYGIPRLWSGGYSYFHRNVPLTYTIEKREMLNLLRTSRDSGKNGAFFAFKKGYFKYFEGFKNVLKPVTGTDEFDLYEMIPLDIKIDVLFSKLPRNTKDGSSWNANGNIVMGKKGVVVIFQESANASKIKIALDSSDKYEISFQIDGQAIESVLLQPHRNKRGMFINSIDIPKKIRESGFNIIEITPVAGDGAYSLGSIQIIN